MHPRIYYYYPDYLSFRNFSSLWTKCALQSRKTGVAQHVLIFFLKEQEEEEVRQESPTYEILIMHAASLDSHAFDTKVASGYF